MLDFYNNFNPAIRKYLDARIAAKVTPLYISTLERKLFEAIEKFCSLSTGWTTSKLQKRVVGDKSFGSQEATMTRDGEGRVEYCQPARETRLERVVYFKFFQTLRRTRRERKKASVAKKRRGVEVRCTRGGVRRWWYKGREKGGKEREVSHRAREQRYHAGNRAKKERKKEGRSALLFEPLDKFYI